jgi:predicted metal-dependent hydrolase
MDGPHPEPRLIQTAPPYQLRRSARARRLRITVRPDGVEVVAPLRMRDADIAAFVERSRPWIDAKLAALQRVLAAHPGSRHLIDGTTILYRGEPTQLRVRAGERPRVRAGSGIVATAQELDATLLTADEKILAWPGRLDRRDARVWSARERLSLVNPQSSRRR